MKKSLLCIVFVFFQSLSAQADITKESMAEVEYLLNLVKNTPCSIIRNGKRHDGQSGYDHIQRKYEHFRDEIGSTEDFIALSASKSTLSGQYYYVQCGSGVKVRTKDWLLRELALYRQKA